MTRVSKPFHIALALAVGLVLLYLASVAVMSTDRFHRFLLAQVTTKLQEITGARVEISSLSFHAYSLQMTLHGLMLHGREASSQPALFSARTLVIGINPITILRRRLILRRFDLQNAAVYLRRYSDGSTNFPGPSLNGERALRDFLSLSVTGLTISRTSFFWNDQVVPLDLSARNVILVLRRVPLRRYAGSFSCAQLSVARQKPGLPPLYLAGRIDFSRDDLDITGLEWRLLDSSLHTAGITGRGSVSVRRLPSFVAEASVRAEGGVAILARLFEVHELTGGNFTLVTNTVYHNGQLQSRGHFQAREVEIRSPRFTPLRVALSSDYAADRAHLQFPNLRAAVLNGEIQGRADVSLQRSTPMFAVRTQVRGISVSDVLESFREGQTLMRNLPLRAGLNGSVDASWSGKLQNFASHFDLRFSPAEAGTPAGSRPLAGTVRGTARLNGEPSITLEAGDFHLPHSSLTTQGTLGGPQSNLVAQAQTSDFEEVRRLIQELSDPPIEIPLRLKSMAVFSGSMSGPMMNPLVRGQLRAGAFELGGWSWGGFEGGVTVASTRAQVSSGKLVSGGSAIIFDLGAALEKWRLTPASLVRVSAQAQDISVERLRDALNFPYPVTGRVSGTVNVEGTRSTQAGNGNLRIEKGTFHGEPFDWLTAQLRVIDATWNLPSIELAKGNGRATGEGWIKPVEHSFSAQLHGTGFNIADWKLLERQPYGRSGAFAGRLQGELNFDASGHGTLDDPQIHSAVEVRNFAINEIPAGKLHAQLEWHGREIKLRGDSEAPRSEVSPDGNSQQDREALHFDCKGQTEGNWPFTADVQYANYRLDPWIDLFRRRAVNAAVVATGSFTAKGPLKDPARFEARGEANGLQVGFAGFKLNSDRPIAWRYSDPVLAIERFRLRGPSTDFEVLTSVNFTSQPSVLFTAQGHADAKVLTVLDPAVQAAGSLELNVKAAGPVARPNLSGILTVHNLGIGYGDLPLRVPGLNGEIKLEGERATISYLRGASGPSVIDLSGYVTLSGTPGYDLRADLDHARIGFPAEFTSVLTGSMHLVGGLGGGRLTGELGVTQMFASENFNLLAWVGDLGLQMTKQSSGMVSPIASNIRLDVQVNSQPQVRIDSRNLQVVADVDMHVRGSLAAPVAFGAIHIESGQAVIRGDRYRLTRGDITMSNPFRTQMNVDLEARTRVQDYDLTLDITGVAERTKISYRSDPPLPTEEILSLLALGYARQEEGLNSAANRPFSSIGASALLSQALSSQTSGRLQRLFGVSRIKIDPNISGPLASGGPRVTIEEQVARDFTITYSQNASGVQQRVIEINWDLTDRVSLIGDRDQNGVFGLELRLRHRFK